MESQESILNNSSTHENSEAYSRGIVFSIILHIIVVGYFVLQQYVFNPQPLDLRGAIRVDIVGLPDKLNSQALPTKVEKNKDQSLEQERQNNPSKPADTKTQVSQSSNDQSKIEKSNLQPAKDTLKNESVKIDNKLPSKKNLDAINLNKTKQKQRDAFKKLKEISAIDHIKSEIEKESRNKNQKMGPVKGAVISPGTELTGLDKIQNDDYVRGLDRHIKQYWALPEWLAKKKLVAQAKVFIDEQGQVIRREIVKSSGNSSFDEKTLETIDSSNPFPRPPEKLSAKMKYDGVLIGFGE